MAPETHKQEAEEKSIQNLPPKPLPPRKPLPYLGLLTRHYFFLGILKYPKKPYFFHNLWSNPDFFFKNSTKIIDQRTLGNKM